MRAVNWRSSFFRRQKMADANGQPTIREVVDRVKKAGEFLIGVLTSDFCDLPANRRMEIENLIRRNLRWPVGHESIWDFDKERDLYYLGEYMARITAWDNEVPIGVWADDKTWVPLTIVVSGKP